MNPGNGFTVFLSDKKSIVIIDKIMAETPQNWMNHDKK
jgi:uncharacterized protein YciI